MTPRIIARCLVFALLPASLAAQAKPAITPKDYGTWESLGAASLSPDGRWLAHGVNRVNEENELRLRGPRDTSIVTAYASGAIFSADSKWIAYAIGVSPSERERLEKEKKPVRNSLGFRSLATGEQTTVADVNSFRFSANGKILAFRRYPAEGKRMADVLIQDLGKGTRLTIGNVSDYAWSESRQLLALTIETDGGSGNGIHLYDASTGVLRALDSSPSLYRALAWRPKSDDLAVLRTKPDKEFKDTTHIALVWTRLGAPVAGSKQLDPATAVGFPREMRVAEHRRPEWSDDGSVLFVGLRPRERARQRQDTSGARPIVAQGGGQVRQAGSDGPAPVQSADTTRAKATTEKPSDVQVWHSRDVRIMPMQKVQEQQELQRTLLTAWHLSDGHVVQIGTKLLETARPLEGAAFATETDRDRYEFGTMFGRPYQDIWLINVKTGERRKVIEKARFFYGGSATGRKLLWYDGNHYWTQDVASGVRVNLSDNVKTSFANPDYDFPNDMTPPLGIAGWAMNDRAVLVNDEHDVWSLNVDGSGGTRLTNGAPDRIVHRYARTGRDEDGIDISKPLYFSIVGKRSKKSGFARMIPGRAAERVVLEDARLSRLLRADSTDVFAFVRERFDDSPDWFVGGADLTSARQRSETNASQRNFAWGRSELVDFKSTTGRDLQAALYYPANHHPSKKYPMIVYTYELLSQNVHGYVVPSERSYYSVAAFTANGYFVLTPDIVFRGRDPGMSTLEAVVPAVQAIVARGLVDSTRVGHVGHSWGGYEATFLPTRTRMFAASVAGAPITNFLSFAGAIHWTPGIAEFDHWETGQARMDVPPWEDMDAYLRNSPIAKVHELRTPLLMEVGDADGTVDWHQGIEFYNFARRAGRKDFVLLVYPGEDHGLRKKENQIDYHRRIQQWFGHYLKGEPAPKWMTEGMTWLDRKAILDGGK